MRNLRSADRDDGTLSGPKPPNFSEEGGWLGAKGREFFFVDLPNTPRKSDDVYSFANLPTTGSPTPCSDSVADVRDASETQVEHRVQPWGEVISPQTSTQRFGT